MIKLIASDLDGTLLRDYQQEVPAEILKEITRLHDKGIIFVAASGRQYAGIRRLFAPLGFDIPYIAENGSLCVYREEVLSTGRIPDETIRCILDALTEYREHFHTGHCILSLKDTYYTDSEDARFWDYMLNTMRNQLTYAPNLYEVHEAFIKAAICDFNGTKNLEPFFRKRVGDKIRVATSAAHWIDFIAPNANKGSALAVIMEKFGIHREECICFGDQQNDLEMLKMAGTSYAMKTGVPEVTGYADYVIDSVLPVLKTL
ncbi:HAD family hydrolase [Roseburia hominis]